MAGFMQEFNHKHIIINAALRAPPVTVETMNWWLLDTIEAVDMKVLMGPYSVRCETPGNVGITGMCVIETSHMSAHCWEGSDPAFMNADLYSCADFTAESVLDVLVQHFDPIYVHVKLVDRNTTERNGFSVIDSFTRRYPERA